MLQTGLSAWDAFFMGISLSTHQMVKKFQIFILLFTIFTETIMHLLYPTIFYRTIFPIDLFSLYVLFPLSDHVTVPQRTVFFFKCRLMNVHSHAYTCNKPDEDWYWHGQSKYRYFDISGPNHPSNRSPERPPKNSNMAAKMRAKASGLNFFDLPSRPAEKNLAVWRLRTSKREMAGKFMF